MTERAILLLDTSYTLKMIRESQLEQALESRKLGGYFSRVISVHPVAGLFEQAEDRFGNPLITSLDDSHVFVEGKVGISKRLHYFPRLNFIFAQLSLFRLLLRMAREAKVDLIRIGDPYFLGLHGLMLARILKVPLAIRVGGRFDEIVRVTGRPMMPGLFRFRWIEKVVERFVFPRCDLIAGANEDNKCYALENGGRPEVATVFRYGNLIHPAHWEDPRKREITDEILPELGLAHKRFVVTVARLESVKRLEHVIRAVAMLNTRGTFLKALIVGDGVQKEELMRLAHELGAETLIVFAGNRSQEWLASVLPRAAAVASPQMGRALTEAALSGVPLVAYDFDWQPEVVLDGETGYLVPDGDWMGMCEMIQRIVDDPGEGERMGRNARNKMLEMMNPERLEMHERQTYTNLLKKFHSQNHLRAVLD